MNGPNELGEVAKDLMNAFDVNEILQYNRRERLLHI